MAGHTPASTAQAEAPSAPPVPKHVVSLVEEWFPNPAYVLDRYWRYLHGNAAVEVLFGEVGQLRSCLDGFVDEHGPHQSLPEWEAMAPSLVAEFRSNKARYPDDPRFDEIISRLLEHSPAFARLWEQQDVEETALGEKVVQHSAAGRLVFQRTTVQIADHPDLRVVVLLPKPGTATRERTHTLMSVPRTTPTARVE
nr:hypothetical protein [Actinopolyspora biskrensis]